MPLPLTFPLRSGTFARVGLDRVRLGCVALGCAWLLVSCSKDAPPPAPAASASAAPVAAPSAAAVVLPAYAVREIPAGPGPTGAFTVAYSIERQRGDENKTWLEAVNACGAIGKSLCTETQWMKACSLDASLGNTASWTLTADFPGAAVRGGGPAGCGTRSFVKVSERSPDRVGLCCSRAVAISTSVTAGTFRADMNERILKYETALNQCDTLSLGELYCDKVAFEKDDLEAKSLVERHELERKTAPDLLFAFDRCSLKQAGADSLSQAQAQCTGVTHKLGATRGGTSLIAWNDEGRITYYGSPKNYRAPAREAKERINSFITSP